MASTMQSRTQTTQPQDALGPRAREAAQVLLPAPGACSCCGGEGGRVLMKECHDLLHGVAGSWSLIECSTCGLIRTDPMPADDQLAALYPSGYGPHTRG